MSDSTAVVPTKGLTRKIRLYGLLLLIIALVLGVWGIASRVLARETLGKDTERDAVPTVVTVHATRSDMGEELVLPGNVQAFKDAPIYARTSGYVKNWYTDIGSTVKKGQLMAEIEAPEVDRQLTQAQADLATAKANETLSKSTNERWQSLLGTESVSKQDADEKAGDFAAKKAAADSAAANVGRLRELESFKRVVAPFDGVVTTRNTDIGSLINAGQSSGTELFRVADTTKLRIYVLVPEIYSSVAKPGVEADLKFAEHRNQTFAAVTVRTANALDPTLRTLQVELQMDNAKGVLFPGAYAEVHFKLPGDAQTLRLPAATVVFRAAGLQVAVVDAQKHVTLKNIVQGRDFGNSIEVLSGIDAKDSIVINPPDSIVDGMTVRIGSPPPEKQEEQGKKT